MIKKIRTKEGRSSRSILEFTSKEARRFFLKDSSYCNFDLPPYITFNQILCDLNQYLRKKRLDSMKSGSPKDYSDVNHIILNNKDGKYAWRPLHLIHPVLYVALVHKITELGNWKIICARFKEFTCNRRIKCLSVPVESLSSKKDRAEQISQWWHEVEQRSIELSLDYEYLIETDIANCYGSIYTHSIAWALHTKKVAKDRRNRNNKTLLGNNIDWYLQDMNCGQTNGIPQGSTLMDFIAEMVLGYTDLKFSDKLKEQGINGYHILRYRDDYRIFVNDPTNGERIVKVLTETLIDLGFKLNPTKTKMSGCVIRDSVKNDKLSWIGKKQWDKNLQKHLIIIHEHALQFPNAGSLIPALSLFYQRIVKRKHIDSLMPLLSIVVDVAYHNPGTYFVASAIISKCISLLNNNAERRGIIKKIMKRFKKIPNTGHMQIWLQRIALNFTKNLSFEEKICCLVVGKKVVLWNIDWISDSKLRNIVNPSRIVDKGQIKVLPPVVSVDEIELFMKKTIRYS